MMRNVVLGAVVGFFVAVLALSLLGREGAPAPATADAGSKPDPVLPARSIETLPVRPMRQLPRRSPGLGLAAPDAG